MIPVEEIKEKLAYLRRKDKNYTIFGAEGHKYELEPVADEQMVIDFETAVGCRLPEDYREFILKVGNGGAGPEYGFSGLYYEKGDDIEQYKIPYNPNNFEWVLPSDTEAKQGIEYDFDLITGAMFMYDGGCGISTYLIINSIEYHGELVVFGYCPIFYGGHFLKEYMYWLNNAVKRC
ncbi:MAG: SMI1/KNR4 family protein [Saprospiraceae bacterium]|nr:SMI1/KNR4 family protein [Saprospiraceae bacterium]